jgi:hypothetical protein
MATLIHNGKPLRRPKFDIESYKKDILVRQMIVDEIELNHERSDIYTIPFTDDDVNRIRRILLESNLQISSIDSNTIMFVNPYLITNF